ncbi:MAG TPA: hypothetical protein VGN72_21395 [Tepidisphaeraceae bacterium]|jgi:hypothetical protein|nr:hypothetical protein [Tepidisphaeraceae bacterium]
MLRRALDAIAAIAAVLFLLLVAVWVLRPSVEWDAGQPKWFSFDISYGDQTPEVTLLVGRYNFILNGVSIVFPMAVSIIVCVTWLVIKLLRRRRRSAGKGFPVVESPPAAG